MEREIRQRYHGGILDRARERFGLLGGEVCLLDGFESYLFEAERDGRPCVLRLSHSIRRSPDLVHAELHFISYLVAGGATVAAALPSQHGKLVELIPDHRGGHFLATLFQRAPGEPPWERNFWTTPPLWESYGRLLGRMHRLSQDYRPLPGRKRPEWDDPIMLDVERWIPASQPVVVERYRETLAHVSSLPREAGSYGLIHQDAHAANFYLDDDGRLTLFDFDDCTYAWYAFDLAMVLFYAVITRSDADAFGRRFWGHFMRGYAHEHSLAPEWLSEIPAFMKLREIDVYAMIHRSLDVENLEEGGWDARFMKGRRQSIENRVPCIGFDPRETIY